MSSPPTTPVIKKDPRTLQRLNAILDEHVLPYPVRFLTNRVIILATLALLVPLFFFTNDQSFVNVLNGYLNVMSVVVSSTVLLYATIAEVRDRAAAERADEIAKAYEQVLKTASKGAKKWPRLTNRSLKNVSRPITNLSSKFFRTALRIFWEDDWKRYGSKITNSLMRCKKP